MELYLEPIRRTRNPINGKFLKGHNPHNKGKKWEDYMDMRKAKRIKRIAKRNLRVRYDIGGWNKRQVIGIKDGKIIGVFESATKAGKQLNLTRRNISHCCNGKRKHCGGIRWFFEDEINKWIIHVSEF
jgi:hypothetical protein